MKTTKCPNCNKDVLLDEKKCNHCNTIISEVDSLNSINTKMNVPNQNYKLLIYACYAIIFFTFVDFAHDIGNYSVDVVKSNVGSTNTRKYKWIIDILAKIPEWFSILVTVVLWTYLLIGIKKLFGNIRSSIKIPIQTLIILTILSGIFILGNSLMEEDSDDIFSLIYNLISILLLFMYVIYSVLVGLKLWKIKTYDNFSYVGLSFVLFPLFLMLLSTLFFIYEEVTLISIIISGLIFGVCIYPILTVKNLFKEALEKN